jgi:hypothetical protein
MSSNFSFNLMAKFMNKIFILILFCFSELFLNAQPSAFSWTERHYKTHVDYKFNYISSAKDQKEQGPCNIFAAVAAVEAMSQIYYNKQGTSLDLSESHLYSDCCSGGCSVGAATLSEAMNFFISYGVVDNSTLPFPENPLMPQNCFWRDTCNTGTPSYRVKIPGYQKIEPQNNNDLKRAIMDYGPIIVQLGNQFSCLYHDYPCGENHTVLIVGWDLLNSETRWQIKDSWPGNHQILYFAFNIFNYDPKFYYVKTNSAGVELSCEGDGCNIFNSRSYHDYDQDGFYNWGIGTKPSGLTSGPNVIDFNDDDASVISLREDYTPASPNITGPDHSVCPSGDTFVLNSRPAGFTFTWSVTPSYYFSGSTSGDGYSATVYPLASEIMKTCTITFTIHETATSWTKQYSKNFIINGPNPSEITVSVEDYYGGTPTNYGGIWYLCPNSTYYIYLNNNSTCSTSDYSWVIPQGWTQYWSYSNYVSINTGDQVAGTLEVYAKTCCSPSTQVKIKTQHFGEDNCGGYFLVYPNPSDDRFTIFFKDKFDLNAKNISLEIYDLNYNSKYIVREIQKENIIETSNWKEGYYYIRLIYNQKLYSSKIKVSH